MSGISTLQQVKQATQTDAHDTAESTVEYSQHHGTEEKSPRGLEDRVPTHTLLERQTTEHVNPFAPVAAALQQTVQESSQRVAETMMQSSSGRACS
eukprot:m.1374652 g.1374652  ORF g.1374652 m.1374652 type:complete len:96 (+) comp24960_c1_seq7:3289-3576(+)